MGERRAIPTDPPPRIYLAVPYAERARAKAAGACWDPARKCWYAEGEVPEALRPWVTDGLPPMRPEDVDPQAEFAAVMQQAGCIVSGPHPIMDGERHRIATEGDKRSRKSGTYKLHGDGLPAGWVVNHRTGEFTKWHVKAPRLTPEEKAHVRAHAANLKAELVRKRAAGHQQAAARVKGQLAQAVAMRPGETTVYLERKGVTAHRGLYASADRRWTYVPMYDLQGRLWTMQTIDPDGDKRYAEGGRAHGSLHVLGGLQGLDRAARDGVVVLSEGYATAATVLDILKDDSQPVACVAAFHADNLTPVAEAIRARYPGAAMLIAGDDDRQNKNNAGRRQATAAAEAVAGAVAFPPFTAGHPTSLSDWNDLDQHPLAGYDREAHRHALRTVVAAAHTFLAATHDGGTALEQRRPPEANHQSEKRPAMRNPETNRIWNDLHRALHDRRVADAQKHAETLLGPKHRHHVGNATWDEEDLVRQWKPSTEQRALLQPLIDRLAQINAYVERNREWELSDAASERADLTARARPTSTQSRAAEPHEQRGRGKRGARSAAAQAHPAPSRGRGR